MYCAHRTDRSLPDKNGIRSGSIEDTLPHCTIHHVGEHNSSSEKDGPISGRGYRVPLENCARCKLELDLLKANTFGAVDADDSLNRRERHIELPSACRFVRKHKHLLC